jgi:hypothetical protein
VITSPQLSLYAVPAPAAGPAPAVWRRAVVVTTDLLALVVLLGVAVLGLRRPGTQDPGNEDAAVLGSRHPPQEEH